MENMEKISWRIWDSDGFGKVLLIGGLLFYVPVLNLLLLGYYGLWVNQLVHRQGLDLPQWREGRTILNELGRVILPFVVWVFLPFVLAGLLVWAAGGILDFLRLSFFTVTLAWLPVALVALLSPLAYTVSLVRLYRSGLLRDALMIGDVLHVTLQILKRAFFPLVQFYGILALGYPLLGFSAFLATLPLLAQLIVLIDRRTEDLKNHAY